MHTMKSKKNSLSYLNHIMNQMRIIENNVIRKRNLALQQRYNEDEVIMKFLFEEDRMKMEERKSDLYSMWKLRKSKQ